METRYAKSGDVSIAYQVVGDGPRDVVFVMGWVSNVEWFWEEPGFARFLRRLASFSRLIVFDKRGTGLSDRIPVSELPTLEQRMDDVRAVMDAVGSSRAALLGVSEGGPLCALFAATYPERTAALVMIGGYGRRAWAPDYPQGTTAEEHERALDSIERGWGGPVGLASRAPSMVDDPAFVQWWTSYLRMSASPSAVLALTRMNEQIDIRPILTTIRVPTLVMHRSGDRALPVEGGRYLAEHIPGARYVELPGTDHLPFVGDQDAILDEVEEFLTGAPADPEADRVLLTVLAAEFLGLEHAGRHGDRRWRDVLDACYSAVRKELARFRGREVEASGGRLLATFDGPARAIRCARAIDEAARAVGLGTRSGLHTGECELVGDSVRGIAVQLAGQVMASAAPGEVLVSSTVKDLVAGSGLHFADLGDQQLEGLPGEWRRLFRAADQPMAALDGISQPAPVHRKGRARPAPTLTPREQEVAALLARGLTNRQIAEELVIAEATAERHVLNIFNKLGFHSRTQIAAWTVEQGLQQV